MYEAYYGVGHEVEHEVGHEVGHEANDEWVGWWPSRLQNLQDFGQNFKQDSNVTSYQLEASSGPARSHISRSSKSILAGRVPELPMLYQKSY